MRYGDYKKLKPANIFPNEIKMTTEKVVDVDHRIPLNKFAKEILKTYENTIHFPVPKISLVKLNLYIKECCKLAGINTITEKTYFSGKKRIEKRVPKYKLITSHTGKKTFTTNSLVLGMEVSVIRKIIGNKDEKSMRPYLAIAEDKKQQEMNNSWDKVDFDKN